MQYRPVTLNESEAVRHFLHRMGWSQRVRDAATFRRLLTNTSRTMSAWDGDRLIGFARALCDDVSNGYISMVAVDPAYHGHGIGRALIERLINHDDHITWVLRAGRDSHEFWEHLGFQHSDLAMERLRKL